jgi:hypothetical protein
LRPVQLDFHACGDDAPRYIDHVNGNAGHKKIAS